MFSFFQNGGKSKKNNEINLSENKKRLVDHAINIFNTYKNNPDHYAIIFDIDDTLINDSGNAIPGMLDIYNLFKDHNSKLEIKSSKIKSSKNTRESYSSDNFLDDPQAFFHIHLITARPDYGTNKEDTIKELKNAGYDKFHSIYLRPVIKLLKGEKFPIDDHDCVCFYKERTRCYIHSKHEHKILLNIGDQNTDLLGGFYEFGWKLPSNYNGDCKHVDITKPLR
jgi:hypothetical protein